MIMLVKSKAKSRRMKSVFPDALQKHETVTIDENKMPQIIFNYHEMFYLILHFPLKNASEND